MGRAPIFSEAVLLKAQLRPAHRWVAGRAGAWVAEGVFQHFPSAGHFVNSWMASSELVWLFCSGVAVDRARCARCMDKTRKIRDRGGHANHCPHALS